MQKQAKIPNIAQQMQKSLKSRMQEKIAHLWKISSDSIMGVRSSYYLCPALQYMFLTTEMSPKHWLIVMNLSEDDFEGWGRFLWLSES